MTESRPLTKQPPVERVAHTPFVYRLEQFGLIIVWLLLIAVFGYLRPDTFLTWPNFSTILGSQAVLVVVTLGLIIPLTANDFDLSIAFIMTMSSMLVAVLNVNYEIGIGWAVIAALALGIAVGLINGLLITIFRIHSLIVTLGTGTFLHGATLWLSDSMTISGISPSLMNAVIVDRLFGVPLEFYYAIVLAALVWYLLEYTALGRRILFVGRGREVARLSGINTDRIRDRLSCRVWVLRRFGWRPLRRHSGRGGPGVGRHLSAAGLRRRLSWLDLHHAWPLQSLGRDGRRLFPGHWDHRSRLSGLQLVHPGDVLWRRLGDRRHLVSTCARPSGAAVLTSHRFIWSQTLIPRSLERDFVGYGGQTAQSALAGRGAPRAEFRAELRGGIRIQHDGRRRRQRRRSYRIAERGRAARRPRPRGREHVRIRQPRRVLAPAQDLSRSENCR